MLFRCPAWLAGTEVPYIIRALTYSFFHANIFHLAVNCISVWVLYPRRDVRNFLAAFAIAVLVYPLGFRPCVGFSNVLFAACGLRARPFSCTYWWKAPTTIAFLAVMVAMCFFPQFSGTNHLAAFLLGMLFTRIDNNILEPIRRDVRRYTGNR